MSLEGQKITIPIQGMHCNACELIIGENIKKIQHVDSVQANCRKGVVEISYNQRKPSMKAIEQAIHDAGYSVGVDEKRLFFSRNPRDYLELILATIIVVTIFFILKSIGVTSLGISSDVSMSNVGVAVLIGLVAGFSSCMALIGGLVLGITAEHARKHPEATTLQKFRPHLFFNLGRIGGYALFGGLLGLIGSVLQLSTLVTGFMVFLASAVMLFIGLKLIDISPFLSSWNISLPKKIAQFLKIHEESPEYNHGHAFFVGALTFFLPCGFTQAMQIFAISSGSFLTGAAIMGLFALGTSLGMLSIGGLASILKEDTSKKFFRIAGVIIIAFAFFNLSNSLALAGIQLERGEESVENLTDVQDPNVELMDGVQVVRMVEDYNGYSPNTFTIHKGIPVRWIIDAKAPYSCASNLASRQLGLNQYLVEGENIIEFTPVEEGSINFSCGMGMYRGSFKVK